MMEALTVRPIDLVLLSLSAALLGAAAGYLLRGWVVTRRRANGAERSAEEGPTSGLTPGVTPAWAGVRATVPAGSPHTSALDPAPSTGDPPAARTTADEREAGVGAGRGGGDRGPLVLIVDDRFELRAINGSYLRGHGYRVREAADGEAALAAVRREHPDVILLDHSLPYRTGLEVLRELKADPGTAAIPVVFMTAHSYGAVGRSAVAAGCAAFLSKPVDPSRVMVEVARHVGMPARA
jgi:CheY-like chemotaxis protein